MDARGKAVSPGFINMLAHPEESLIADGRAVSDLSQGVTLEVMGEISMGPLSPEMKALAAKRQGDIKYPVDWTTLGDYLAMLQKRGIAPNIASFVGAGTVRQNVLGEADVQPTPAQLVRMQGLVRQAMEEGALGVTTALIYAPNTYAKTPELIALAKVSAQCGGIYTVHMRSEGDRLEEAVQETIDIARASGAPAEIYHFKQAGRANWGKIDRVIAMIDAARGVDVHVRGDPGTPGAGPDGLLLLGFNNPKLKPLAGRTLADVARERGTSPEDTAMDLVIEDGSRVGVAYFLMDETNVRRAVKLPWMSFGSDAEAPAPEGVFLLSKTHPRAYGNVARLLGHYVRETGDVTLPDAIRRLTSLPADNLSLADRGRLKVGAYADVVVFDPATIAEHGTYDDPAQLATGVAHVLVNGGFALRDGKPTGLATGRVVRGRAWNGAPGGGCRASASQWRWIG